jgi:hypothetical protein
MGLLYLYHLHISVKRRSQPQSHSVAGIIMSMKNSNDTIGDRTRDLPACTTVVRTILKFKI